MIRSTALVPAVLVLAMAASILLPVGAARARSDYVGLSRDGHHWRDALTRGLFGSRISWVPGDVRTAHFFVRNQGPTGAVLTVAARVRDRDRLHAGHDIRLQVRNADGPWKKLSTGRVGTRIQHLAEDARTQVQVRARFLASSTNPKMRRTLSFTLFVRLTQGKHDTGKGDGGGDGPRRPDDGLPDTGAPSIGVTVALALLLLTGGTALIARTSRKET